MDSSTVAEERVPELNLPEDSSVLTDQPAEIVAELFQQATQATSDNLAGDDCSTHLRERRSHPRQQIRPLSFIELGRDNGGVLLNIGEGGLALTAAMTLTEDDPTWAAEYTHFKSLCRARQPADLSVDLWLNRVLRRLGRQALNMVTP